MGLIAKGLKHNHTLVQIFAHGNQGCVSGHVGTVILSLVCISVIFRR